MSLLNDGQKPPFIVPVQNGQSQQQQPFVLQPEIDLKQVTSKQLFWQIFPSLCTSLIGFSFGIMLGWPSPTYILLLDESVFITYDTNDTNHLDLDPNPLPITLVQSPLIAGLLMVGMIVGTPFSHYALYGTKQSIAAALLTMSIGWAVAWQANNIYHLLIARFLIGLANGYGIGQVRAYITEITSSHLTAILLRLINVLILTGVAAAYIMGVFLDFRWFSITAMLFTSALFTIVIYLPHSPAEYLKFGSMKRARVIAYRLGIQQSTHPKAPKEYLSIRCMWRNNPKRAMWSLVCLTFIQQFVGAPATVVYCQFLLVNLGLPRDATTGWCTVIYICVYIVAYTLGTFYFCGLKPKVKWGVLLVSIVLTNLTLVLLIVLVYADWRQFNVYVPFAGLVVYIFCYGVGLGSIPNAMIDHFVGSKWRAPAGRLQLVCFCLFAIIITKLFQVFYAAFALHFVFVLFLATAFMGLIFVAFYLPRDVIID